MRNSKRAPFSHHVYICHGVNSFILKTDATAAIPVQQSRPQWMWSCVCVRSFNSSSFDPLRLYLNLRLSSYFYMKHDLSAQNLSHYLFYLKRCFMCFCPLRLDSWRLMFIFNRSAFLSTTFDRLDAFIFQIILSGEDTRIGLIKRIFWFEMSNKITIYVSFPSSSSSFSWRVSLSFSQLAHNAFVGCC